MQINHEGTQSSPGPCTCCPCQYAAPVTSGRDGEALPTGRAVAEGRGVRRAFGKASLVGGGRGVVVGDTYTLTLTPSALRTT